MCKSVKDSTRFGSFSLASSFKTDSILKALFIVTRHIIFATQRHGQVWGSQGLVFRGSGTVKRGVKFGWAEREERVIQLWLGGLKFHEWIEGSKRRGERVWSNGCLAVRNGCCNVAEKMEEYNAQKVATTISARMLEDLISGLDRAALVELLNLEIEWPLVTDIKGVHPPSVAAPSTLKIHGDDCPFIGAGTSADCCTGSVLARRGHLTVSMPCYRTDVLHDNSLCAHCEELWADKDDAGFYVLKPKLMKKAAEVYKAGQSGVMKKWLEMKGARTIFESEALAAKDVFADSTDELEVTFPGMDFDQFCKEVLNASGVLAADAGKSRNPYRRTAAQQTDIGQYAQRMAVLWIRVKAAVKPAIFKTFVTKLRGIARRVEQAAKWTLQKAFQYPVFVGPLVCADIMLAGFLFADQRYEHQLGRVMQNSGEARDESPIKVGPVLDRMDRWAKTVKAVRLVSPTKRRPKASSKAASGTPLWDAAATASTPVAKNLTSAFEKAGGRKAAASESARGAHPDKGTAGAAKVSGKAVFYGVGRGFKPGVYTSWDEANKQIKNFSGCRIKKFRTRVGAEKFVKELQEEPQVVWWVLKNSHADGAYESKGLASLYNTFGSTMVKRHSLSAAKRFLGKSRIKVYREDAEGSGARVDVEAKNEASAAASVEAPAAATSTSAAAKGKRQFFACKDSAQDGVYATLKEVLAAVKGGGVFEVFYSEAEAAEYCKPADAAPDEEEQEVFVVWSGKATGVMSAAECVKATAGVHGAEAEGPMVRSKAVALWQAKRKSTSAVAEEGGSGELQHVEYPSDDEWAKVAASTQTRVFACWVEKGKGRISFTWDAAVSGGKKDTVVKVFSSEDTLFLNFARAEEYLASSTSRFSIKAQLAAARKSVAKKPTPRKKADAKATEAVTASTGQSVGSRVGLSGVVLTREVTQIRRCFVDAPTAVQLVGAPAEPEEDELERDMPAPGAATYLSQDVEKQVSGSGDLTLLEYFSYKKAKMKAWPLKDYDEFLAFCRQGQRLCVASSKEVGAVNAVFFQKLLDIAVRTHGQMVRRGTLGVNEIRFQVRMYLHLQYATNHKVLHTGAGAMRAYEAAVDTFGVAKVPRFRRKARGTGGDSAGSGYSGSKFGSGAKKGGSGAKQPASGCWLCPASDHYASDQQFHPRPADGKRAPLSADKKKAIIARVDASSLTADEKKAEKAAMTKYWAQHSL